MTYGKKLLATVFAASVAISAGAANAETITKRVSYADLDLTSQAGKGTLEGRVKHAVVQVCGSRATAGLSLSERRQINRCRATASAKAQSQMNVAIARAAQQGGTQLADAR